MSHAKLLAAQVVADAQDSGCGGTLAAALTRCNSRPTRRSRSAARSRPTWSTMATTPRFTCATGSSLCGQTPAALRSRRSAVGAPQYLRWREALPVTNTSCTATCARSARDSLNTLTSTTHSFSTY
eukprot:scaffold263834_cov35-Tisochrysis_lutea.AAC.3